MRKILTFGFLWVTSVLSASVADQKALLDVHNELRGEVSLSGLQWSDGLASVAQRWANRCRFEHNANRNKEYGRTIGENIAWMSSRPSPMGVAAELWGDEKGNWACQANRCRTGQCGHYTQMVWAGTTQVGCGLARCNGSYYVVCNYFPAGNYVGKRPFSASQCP